MLLSNIVLARVEKYRNTYCVVVIYLYIFYVCRALIYLAQ